MSIHCTDIDTLVHSYLDGELADDDVDALHEHIAECSKCKGAVAEEAQFHHDLRKKLAPPAAPADLRERIVTALDREDWNERKQSRSRWSWSLPGAASLAAVAALLLFVFTTGQNAGPHEVTYEDAVRPHIRRMPIEVQGAKVGPWIEQYAPVRARPPRFPGRETQLHGARLNHILGRDAVQFYYETTVDSRRYKLTLLISDARGIDFPAGRTHRIAGRMLHIGRARGYNIISFKDAGEVGYFFISEMSADDLMNMVANSDLIWQAPDGAR